MVTIDIDSGRNILASGSTKASNYAALASPSDSKAFVALLSSTTGSLQWAKYFEDFSYIVTARFNFNWERIVTIIHNINENKIVVLNATTGNIMKSFKLDNTE